MSPSRLPGSRELLWILRLNWVHPVIWSKDQFVVSGTPFAVLVCVLALYSLYDAFEVLIDPRSVRALVKASNNPIRSDMDSLMAILGATTGLTSFAYIILFLYSRRKLAVVFNELNSIWLALGSPRLRLGFAAFVSVLWSLFLIVSNAKMLASDKQLFSGALSATQKILDRSITIVFKLNSFSAIATLMMFVYGSLTDTLSSALHAFKDTQFKVHNMEPSLRNALPRMARLLSSFSSVVSPLITLTLLALVCLVLQILFLCTVGRQKGDEIAALCSILLGSGFLLAISMVMSHLLEGKITELRDLLQKKHVLNEISPRAFQEFDLILKRVSHPAKILNVFHLNMGVVLSMVTFFLNYYMTFIQFKAILVGTSTNSNASS